MTWAQDTKTTPGHLLVALLTSTSAQTAWLWGQSQAQPCHDPMQLLSLLREAGFPPCVEPSGPS